MNIRDYSDNFTFDTELFDQYVYFESYNYSGKEMWAWGIGKVVSHTKFYIDILPIGSRETHTVACGPTDFMHDIIIPLGW